MFGSSFNKMMFSMTYLEEDTYSKSQNLEQYLLDLIYSRMGTESAKLVEVKGQRVIWLLQQLLEGWVDIRPLCAGYSRLCLAISHTSDLQDQLSVNMSISTV